MRFHNPMKPISRLRRGVTTVYAAVVLVALCGLVSFGVDLGRAQLAKTELRGAADAAARAAMNGSMKKRKDIRKRAIDTAAANTCDGTPVALTKEDVELGTWNASTRTFSKGDVAGDDEDDGSSFTAVRVTAHRTAARGNPIELVFARVVGRDSIDITASAVALGSSSAGASGFMSLGDLSFENSSFAGSYDPNVTTNPTQASAGSNAGVGANDTILIKNTITIKGNLYRGPSSNIDNQGTLNVSGDIITTPSDLTAPSMPAWTPSPNPGGIPQTYTVSSNTTLAGGTYWFTSLTISSTLTFSGPATVHVNGNLVIKGNELRAYQTKPQNLVIYQHGDNRTFGDPGGNDAVVTARVIAPGANLSFNNKLTFRGSGVFKSMHTKGETNYFFDQTTPSSYGVGGSGGSTAITLVQ